MGGQLGEFVFRRAEGQAGNVGDFIGDHLRKERMRVEARAHGGAAQGQFKQVVERKVQASKVGIELSNPSRCFLAQGQRNGVHEVRSSDFHNTLPLDGLCLQRVSQGANAR